MVGVAIGSFAGLVDIAVSSTFGPGIIRTFAGEPPAGHLAGLTAFVETHSIRGFTHETFPRERVHDAHRAVAAPGIRGKIVVTTSP